MTHPSLPPPQLGYVLIGLVSHKVTSPVTYTVRRAPFKHTFKLTLAPVLTALRSGCSILQNKAKRSVTA